MIYVPKILIPEVKELIAKYREGEKIAKSLINEKSNLSPSHFNRNKQNRLNNKNSNED